MKTLIFYGAELNQPAEHWVPTLFQTVKKWVARLRRGYENLTEFTLQTLGIVFTKDFTKFWKNIPQKQDSFFKRLYKDVLDEKQIVSAKAHAEQVLTNAREHLV